MRIGIVACSKTKLATPAPAKDLYTSPLFKAARAYCERTYDRWFILSALHGLVEPETVIEPYDVTLARMTAADSVEKGDVRMIRCTLCVVSLVDDVKRLQAEYGKPADHLWIECFHPNTQQGGEGCHWFASCHAFWPKRCGYMHHEHHREGDSALSLPRILALVEAAERFAAYIREFSDVTDCDFCDGHPEDGHDDDCVIQALMAALGTTVQRAGDDE